MGVIKDYATARIEEVKGDVNEFLKGPVDFILNKQVLRKAILLEYLDYARPVVGTRWEHRIQEMVKK